MRSLFSIAVFLLASIGAFAQSIQLSDTAEISIITAAPGKEAIFTAYGHSAIRVYDPQHNIDLVFNWGVFDFDNPNFFVDFAKGHLNYMLGVKDFERFCYPYKYHNRSIYEQVLNLSKQEKQKVMNALMANAKPENRVYSYDYFYDNCSTRPWYILEREVPGLTFDGSFIQTDYSFRDLVDIYDGDYHAWGDFGIDICLGLPIDKTMLSKEYLYLPEYLQMAFDHATINGEPAVLETKVVFKSDVNKVMPTEPWWSPLKTFWTLFTLIAIITTLGTIRNRHTRLIDIVLFIFVGAVGVVLTQLWFFTDHSAAAKNLNLLWAIPFHLIAGVLLIKKTPVPRLSTYFKWTAYLMLLILVFWKWIPQGFNPAFFPIVLILGIRAWFVHKRINS